MAESLPEDSMKMIINHFGAQLEESRLRSQLQVLENMHEVVDSDVCLSLIIIPRNKLKQYLLLCFFVVQAADCAKMGAYDIIRCIGKSDLKKLIPQVIRMSTFLVLSPASTATCERSFSQLRRLKSYLRSSMSQRRINHCLILNSYQEELDLLDVNQLVKQFVLAKDTRRLQFC